MNNKIDTIIENQRKRFTENDLKKKAMIISLFTIIFTALYSVFIMRHLDYNSAIYYDIINIRIIVVITALYYIRYFFFNKIDDSYTMILMTGYMIGTIGLFYIDPIWSFPVITITSYTYILYSIPDVLLGYNIFEPISYLFSPVAQKKYYENLKDNNDENS